MTRSFEGGTGGDFVYDIPVEHMGGTYWYHAHHHGSTFLQVSAGAFGLLLVDDGNDGAPGNVLSMTERQLVIAYLDPDVAGTGGDTLITGTLSPTWTVNGKVGGNLCMPNNSWQHWRVLLADRDAKDKVVSVGEQCEPALMARDGVWRTEVPKPLPTRSLSLTGASRADLAVRCTGDSTISVGSTTVANVVVDDALAQDTASHPWAEDMESTWSAFRPDYLQDLRAIPLNQTNRETVNMGARTINGSKFDHHVPTFVLGTDKVQDWTLKGARNHPFHLHVYHVQVQGDCGDYEDGEYYDVVSGNCNIRFDLREGVSSPYAGRTIMHCHILEHEDQGAMGWADVVGGTPPPTFPAGFGYTNYEDFNTGGGTPPAAPSDLAASANSSSQITLTWTDNSDNESFFDIERADGGSGAFAWIDTAPANSTSYLDEGLTANTSYDYRVRATNADGESDYTNIASAITDPAGNATTVQVRSVTVTTVDTGKGQKRGRATVVIEDDQGQLVSGATISGFFSGTFLDDYTDVGPTGADGTEVFDSADTVKGKVTLEFCVTSVKHGTLADFEPSPTNYFCGSL